MLWSRSAGWRSVVNRASTFSVVRQIAWALDIFAELGMAYDSSIYPVRRDRYGIPGAPHCPSLAQGVKREILELPPATLRIGRLSIPVGGGGYFRLLPFPLMKLALSLSRKDPRGGATVLYFHPWEFDPEQPQLPLNALNRLRTYVGIRRTRDRFARLLSDFSFVCAVDLCVSSAGVAKVSRDFAREFSLELVIFIAIRDGTHPTGGLCSVQFFSGERCSSLPDDRTPVEWGAVVSEIRIRFRIRGIRLISSFSASHPDSSPVPAREGL